MSSVPSTFYSNSSYAMLHDSAVAEMSSCFGLQLSDAEDEKYLANSLWSDFVFSKFNHKLEMVRINFNKLS